MKKGHILVVDDDQSMGTLLKNIFEQEDFEFKFVTSAADGLSAIEQEDFELVLTDIKMSDMDGIAFCQELKNKREHLPVVLMTAFGALETAVAAIRAGAYDFVTKPFDIEVLKMAITRAMHHSFLQKEVTRLQEQLVKKTVDVEIISESKPMQKVFDLIERVAETDATVLITGESGTGKELFAQALHKKSKRAQGAFVMNKARNEYFFQHE